MIWEDTMRRRLDPLFSWQPFFYVLLAVNLYGAVYGFWWYRSQFALTPVYLWPFVPNSPLAVFYFIIVLLYLLQGKRTPFWEGMAYFGLIKHGLWTVAIIWAYELAGRSDPENIFLWSGHLGMALQAVLFWAYYGLHPSYLLATGITGWFMFNDYLDYVTGIYPGVDTSVIGFTTVRALALAYTVILGAGYFYFAWRRSRKEQHE
jgi:uncharacterized membrane protein YpjA